MTNDGFAGLWVASYGGFGSARVADIRAGRVVRAKSTPDFHGGTFYVSCLTLRPGTRTLWTIGRTENDFSDEIVYHAAVATLAAS